MFNESSILDILAASPSLASLRLRIYHLDQENLKQLIRALAAQLNLRQLDLSLDRIWSPSFIPDFLYACKEYKSLLLSLSNLEMVRDASEADQEITENVESTMKQMQDMQVQKLGIKLSNSSFGRILPADLLKHCPLLERSDMIVLQDSQSLRCLSSYFT
ncbi:hypothetical protein BGX26_003997, partial [Mortierella sp. AD094]